MSEFYWMVSALTSLGCRQITMLNELVLCILRSWYSFRTQLNPTTTANGFSDPTAAVADAQGNLWVTDSSNDRILRFGPPFVNGMSANLVLGQMSFTTGANSPAQNGFSQPHGLPFDLSGNLWVADSHNSRILHFSAPFSSGMSATVILGEPGFGRGAYPGVISPSSMCFP